MIMALWRAPTVDFKLAFVSPTAGIPIQSICKVLSVQRGWSCQTRGGFGLESCGLLSKELRWCIRHRLHVVATSALGGDGGDDGDASEAWERPFRIMISTGDVMGDMHGAALIRALIDTAGRDNLDIEVYAVGGQRMKSAGAILIGDNTGLSSIGLLEAVPLIVPSLQIQLRVRCILKRHPPDIVVLIDYPGINIPFAKYVKKQFGCKVVYYIPPNEWLWNTSRTGAIIDTCNAILTVYPAEGHYFRKAGGYVVEVGHPLLDLHRPVVSRLQARKALGYAERDIVILLVPASRPQELRHVWPVVASAARVLLGRLFVLNSCHRVHFIVLSVIPSEKHIIEQGIEEFGLCGHASLWHGDTQRVMPAADLAITKSGSVNLELALHNVPQVVVYKIDKATAWLARNIFQFGVKHISLVNLILEEQVVPEFIQGDADPAVVASAAFDLLPISSSRHRNNVLEGYTRLKSLLGRPGVVNRTARYILDFVKSNRQYPYQ